MSTQTSERLKLIRESERLKMKEAAELAGINYTTYAGYESGKAMMSLENAKKFFKVQRFRKYRDWFMFDEIDPEAGQIAPALAHSGQDLTTSQHSGQKTG
ncbi:helix-turn-helix transcriptional regulator [Escherichia coli]|uniref:Repressor protein n=1 Tax=Escherichia coli TaxID=562 RepID=A0A4C9HHF0_ECOLX|nr:MULTISPECIES: helix-turn-helix transcriptional regulator [Enterobacteriaceae]EJT2828402.1 helix-turn-helix transcriptional regulator [Shigella boydii]EKF4350634.1 helix-turn-helix transcriptional regulator [Escherichia coli O136]EKP4086281.1 helix-turn-helix transcriptional regulator [Escherichia coli O157]MDT3760618.1 helix-turn-helix transcriptional regulator [Citrobacter freundii complex sp. 2023EL-00962]QAR66068.1 XRE family transcriptional regulator [Citrobacter sp. SL156]